MARWGWPPEGSNWITLRVVSTHPKKIVKCGHLPLQLVNMKDMCHFSISKTQKPSIDKTNWQPPTIVVILIHWTLHWVMSHIWSHFPSLAAQADKASANCSCAWIRPWLPSAVNKGGSKARGNGAYKVGEDVVVVWSCMSCLGILVVLVVWWLGGWLVG